MSARPLLLALLLVAACSSGPGTSPTPAGTAPAGSAGPGSTASPGASVSTAPGGPATVDPSGALVRIVGTGLTLGDFPFAVRAARNDDELTGLLADLAMPERPTVDFERELVLYLGVSGSSSCPERFQRLVVDEAAGLVYGEWAQHPPGQPCTDDLQPQGILLVVTRSALPATPFVLSLREQLVCPTCEDHTDRALIDPAG